MKQPTLRAAELKQINGLVQHYVDNQQYFIMLLSNLTGFVEASKKLKTLTHSVKGRVKDPEHLRAKLIRKGLEAKSKGEVLPYTRENLFQKINDLAGFRILHLHTTQIEDINSELLEVFKEQRWLKLEASARTWDDESREYFTSIGIATEESKTMYTSVHYVVQPNSRSALTCEIQVRTLMEEVWGEVDHQINYPVKVNSISCREQLKVLARVTSSCSRLVDSIFLAHQETLQDKAIANVTKKPTREGKKVPS